MDPLKTFVRENPGLSTSELARVLQRDRGVLRKELQRTCAPAPGQNGAVLWFATEGAAKKEAKAADRAPLPPLDPVERHEAETKQARVVREHKTLVDEVGRLREVIALREKLAAAPLRPIVRREFTSGRREATAVALASDWHVEEEVLPGSTPTSNVYNMKIAELRIERFFQGLAWLVKFNRQAFEIRDLVLWFGGDMMSGHIHEENRETSALAPIPTLLWLQPQLESGVRFLLDTLKLERLQLVCSYGNHGRDTIKPRRSTGAHHSYEWGMYQQIAVNFAKDKRVEVLADPSGHQYTRVYDFDLHFHHGDETKYQGGVGGIVIPLNKAVNEWNKARHAHYHHFGHWHQYIDTGNIVVNGSLIGFNPYAMSIKASPEPPQQAFYLLDSKRGKTCKSPLWVSDHSAEKKLWQVSA
jgi:hypothetical protein